MLKKSVVLGLSGGVDSSVAAYLLKEQGYDVQALFMINWKNSSVTLQGQCLWEEDVIVAELVAQKLGIKLHVVDSSEKYKELVVEYMFGEYQAGRTPNPDVLCNREIKFNVFNHYAQQFDAQYVATGHYAITQFANDDTNEIKLISGKDPNKDQSYFLCQLNQQQLKNVIFPIGNILKTDVRKIAEQQNLASAYKKDSQGICFIGKVDLPTFLKQKIMSKNGNIVEISKDVEFLKGSIFCKKPDTYTTEELVFISEPYNLQRFSKRVLGQHQGVYYYTIGQRKGLDIGGTSEPMYIVGTDIERNEIYVGEGQSHWALSRKALFIKYIDIHWIRPSLEMFVGEKRLYDVRIRYRQPLQKACLYRVEEGIFIVFEQMQRGITPGQFAAWYKDGELLGSGVIQY